MVTVHGHTLQRGTGTISCSLTQSKRKEVILRLLFTVGFREHCISIDSDPILKTEMLHSR